MAVAAPEPAPGPTSPRRTILEAEAFVAGAASLLVLQLIFGFCRRRSSSIWIQGPLWLVYTLSLPLVTYTFGLMQSSAAKSQLYPVWAIALFLVAGCTNSITAYDLDETKQWKKQLFELVQQYLYSGLIFLLLQPSRGSVLDELIWNPKKFNPILEFCYMVLGVISITNLFRVMACWMATFSDPSKVIADYMRDLLVDSGSSQSQSELLRGSETDPDPIRKEGGRYLVRWYGYFLNTHSVTAHGYRTKLAEEDIITIDMIWEKCSGMLPFDPSGGSQSKDVCLSFALFHLLKRRYFGINCYEAGLQKTRDFVLNGLLASEDGKRAFRIIEVEMAFMHDFFFTKYACVYENEISFFIMFIMKTILISILGVFVHQNFLTLKTVSKILPVGTTKADTMIALAILAALLIVEILQAMLYLASDWSLVSMACYHVRKGPCQALYSFLHKPIYMLRRKQGLFKYWQNKIGQYSVTEGSRWHKASPPLTGPLPKVNFLLAFILVKLYMLGTEIAWKISTGQYCRSIVQDVRLSDTVKREIASSLKSTAANGHLTNGEASLQRNGVFISPFKETLKRDDWDLTDTMLIWHIATSYCETETRPTRAAEMHLNSDHGKLRQYHEVATTLSRYSAYLMASVPELLPGNPADISFTFDKVMQEATVALYPGQEEDTRNRAKATRNMLTEVLNRSRPLDQEDHNDTIFFRGLNLGKEMEAHIDDEELRWKVIAEFWAEIILYIAPSDNVRGHIERLANGGEFITHIWALLSHAGILTRHPSRQQESSQ